MSSVQLPFACRGQSYFTYGKNNITSTLRASKANNLALDLFDTLNHLDSKSINYHQCTVEQIDINVVVTMPDIPACYKMKSWKQTGIQQDALLPVKISAANCV